MKSNSSKLDEFIFRELLPILGLKIIWAPSVKKSGMMMKTANIKMFVPIENELKRLMQTLQSIPLFIDLNIPELEVKSNLHHRTNILAEFITAVHWIYKKRWHPKHIIPCHKSYAKIIEPTADYYLSILELCNAVYEISRFSGIECTEYIYWFQQILLEIRSELLFEKLPKLAEIKSKTERYNEKIAVLEDLQNFTNPYHKYIQQHRWELMEKTFYLINTKKYENLELNQWKKFLKSYQQMLKIERKRPYLPCVDADGSYLKVECRGNNKQIHKLIFN